MINHAVVFKVQFFLAHPQFFSVDRIVIDTEGRVGSAASGVALPGNVMSIDIVPLGSAFWVELGGTSQPEPLGRGDDQMWWRISLRYQKSRLDKGLGLLLKIA